MELVRAARGIDLVAQHSASSGCGSTGQPYRHIAQRLRAELNVPVIFFRVESHALAFHVGHPLGTVLEWENLDIWAHKPFPVYLVMPADCVDRWPEHLSNARLDEVLRS